MSDIRVQNTKNNLIAALLSCLEDESFHKLKVKDIIDKAGVSTRTFYQYYSDVNDLLRDTEDSFITEYLKNVEKDRDSLGDLDLDTPFEDQLENILNATKKGLTMSLKELIQRPDLIIVDALTHIDTLGIPYESIIKGDAKCYSISAASIIAKVTRDRIMREWDKIYPQYGFVQHKGYGTSAHINAIKEYGPCPLHRKSFIKNFV